jgi:MFS family permease
MSNFLFLNRDGFLLLSTRAIRLFAYGLLSVILVLYLSEVGLSLMQIGSLFTLTLIGDTAISLWLTTQADRIGRRRMLIIGSGLIILAGVVFSSTSNFFFLLFAAIIGVISPTGNEVGPFLSIEQAALSQIISDENRTKVFAWYNLVGAFSISFGSLAGGGIVQILQNFGLAPIESYRVVVICYALIGGLLTAVFACLSSAIETTKMEPSSLKIGLGLHNSKKTVFGLSALFALDAFGGGFVMQSIIAYWFFVKFHVEPATLGAIFFGANLLAGISSLLAYWLAKRFGLINTMVFTHIPSNILLILVPFMPTLNLAIIVLFLRFSISQMDVPTRQSYLMAVVDENERSAAAGISGVARTLGASISPILAGPLLAHPALMNFPFIIAGGLKIIYDLFLYLGFISKKPKIEK